MRWFHDRKTLAKLLGSFAVVCALLGLVGYLGVTTTAEIQQRLMSVSETNLTGIRALNQTRAAMLTVQRDVRSTLLTDDPRETAALIRSGRAALEAMDRAYAAYKALPASAEERRLMLVFEANRDEWRADAVRALDEVSKQTAEGKAAAMAAMKQAASKAVAANEATAGLIDENQRQVDVALAEADSAYARASMLLVSMVGGGTVFALAVGCYVAQSIARPLQAMTRAAEGLAAGDVQQEIVLARRDEVGQTADAFRKMVRYQQEIAGVAEALADGDLTRSVEPKSDRDVLGRAFQRMIASLREILGEVQLAADGVADTSQQLSTASEQSGRAVQQVATAVQQVASGAQQQASASQDTNHAVELLLEAISQVANGAQEQAGAVSSVSSSTLQMASGVEQVAANAQAVAAASQQTRASAQQGSVAVRRTVAGMGEIQAVVAEASARVEELGKLGEKIGAVVETIDDIAEQTNLLALNAAIAAARAGEHGRGFSVVADEVRKLAERSQRETREIGQLIHEVQAGTRDAVSAMLQGAQKVQQGTVEADRAGQALEQILTAVKATVQQVEEIAAAAQEMATRSREVSETMLGMSASVEEATAATEEMAAAAESVGRSIQSIAAVAEENTAATEEVSASAEEMSAQVEEISAQASELASTAEQLQGLVARFRLETATDGVRAGGVRPVAPRQLARPVRTAS